LKTEERILEILKENPQKRFTLEELKKILQKHKTTIYRCIRQLEDQKLVIVKKYSGYKLVRYNDLSIIPIPHEIQLSKSGTKGGILKILKENPQAQFTQTELAKVFNKHKTTIGLCIKQLEKKKLILVKKYGRYKLVRYNDPSITPTPHKIQLLKPVKPKVKSKLKVKKKDSKPKRKDKQIYVPKKIREQLKWEKGSKVLFVEKDEKIYCESNSE